MCSEVKVKHKLYIYFLKATVIMRMGQAKSFLGSGLHGVFCLRQAQMIKFNPRIEREAGGESFRKSRVPPHDTDAVIYKTVMSCGRPSRGAAG